MKKNISILLIACFVYLLAGCYSLQEISKEELIQQVDKSKIRL